VLAAACLFSLTSLAQKPGPNSDSTYQQLRNVGLGGEAVTVNNFTLKRDTATFHLRSGTVCFVVPVEEKVTGAVFTGEGTLVLDPPIRIENASLKLLTRQDEFVEAYQHLVLRFTDSTHEEIKSAGTPGGSCDAGLLREPQHVMRHDKALKYNLEARILQDVLGKEAGGLFVAFVDGRHYNSKELFIIDPHGAPALLLPVAPEEVEFLTDDDNKLGVWAAFHLADEYRNGTAMARSKTRLFRSRTNNLTRRSRRMPGCTAKQAARLCPWLAACESCLFSSTPACG
jgi:hypothetical protein